MAGRFETGVGLSKAEKENASTPKELDSSIGKSSESLSPTERKRGSKDTEQESCHDDQRSAASDKEDVSGSLDLMQQSLIAKAVDRFLEEDADELSDGENIPHTFSQDYEARKKKMLQTAFEWEESESMTKPKRRFRIPAAAAAAVALLVVYASLGVVRAEAMPEPIHVLVMQVQSLFSSASVDDQILYGDNQVTDFPEEIQTVYEPTVVLDGYEESERIFQNKLFQIFYTDIHGWEYSFQQMTIDFRTGYDNEEIVYEEIEVGHNYQGITYVKNSQRYIEWQQDGYVFELTGTQEKEVLEMLAVSIKPEED